MLTFLFLLLALICFVLAALGVGLSRINLVAAGLAFATVPFLVQAWPA